MGEDSTTKKADTIAYCLQSNFEKNNQPDCYEIIENLNTNIHVNYKNFLFCYHASLGSNSKLPGFPS